MPKDRSILLVANARPFEIGKLYFFRDRRLRRLAEEAGARTIEPPGLRRWSEPSAWLDADAKSGLATQARQAESGAVPVSLAREESADRVRSASSNGESARKESAAIDAEISKAIAGITAEAHSASCSTSSDAGEIESALKDVTTIAEKIRKDWSATRVRIL